MKIDIKIIASNLYFTPAPLSFCRCVSLSLSLFSVILSLSMSLFLCLCPSFSVDLPSVALYLFFYGKIINIDMKMDIKIPARNLYFAPLSFPFLSRSFSLSVAVSLFLYRFSLPFFLCLFGTISLSLFPLSLSLCLFEIYGKN